MVNWSVPSPLAMQAQACGRRIAFSTGISTLSFAELAEAAQRRASKLSDVGVRPGDTVVLRGSDSLDKIIWLHGIWWLGACALPLADHTDATDVMRWADAPERIAWVDPEGQAEKIPDKGPWKPRKVLLGSACASASARPALFLPPAHLALDDVMLRVGTSGTTGAPKCVRLKVGQLVFSAFGVASRLGHLPKDCWALTLPLHHVGGLSVLWRALLLGSTVELMLPFEAAHVAERLASGAITLAALVPTMLTRVLDCWPKGQRVPAGLRAVVIGGAAAQPNLVDEARALGLPVVLSWGMSESASQVATQWPDSDERGMDVGPPLPFAQVTTVEGRLALWGPVIGDETTFVTGDMGHIDAVGRVVVAGRADDVLISGGENIAPQEVEAVLNGHPDIDESAVVGRQDALWGQRPVAFLMLRPGRTQPSEAELRAFCRSRLASFKVPVQFVWSASLPKDALGKLRRRALDPSFGGHDGPPRST